MPGRQKETRKTGFFCFGERKSGKRARVFSTFVPKRNREKDGKVILKERGTGKRKVNEEIGCFENVFCGREKYRQRGTEREPAKELSAEEEAGADDGKTKRA